MSHFTVAVIHDKEDIIEDLLDPYYEGLETPRYVKATKEQLIEKGRQEIEEYKNGTYAKFLADPEKYKSECKNEGHIKYLEEEFPKRLEWTDEEVYQDALKWYEKEDIGEDGEVYSSYNPNSKWDWYQIGGRWNNLLKLKDGTQSVLKGEASWGDKSIEEMERESSGRWCDSARIGDIDFEAMKEANKAEAYKRWDEWVEKAQRMVTNEKTFEEAWKEVTAWSDLEGDETKESYAEKCSGFHTYAMLIDGEWIEPGKMGWWGMSHADKDDRKRYYEEYTKRLQDLIANSPDRVLTMVDCHI